MDQPAESISSHDPPGWRLDSWLVGLKWRCLPQGAMRTVFTWGFEIPDHPIPPGSTLVQVDLIPDGDNTLVRLTQQHVPPPEVVPVRRGWDDYLDRLQVAAAGGDPGPNPDETAQPAQGA
jgi:hypothetical protein